MWELFGAKNLGEITTKLWGGGIVYEVKVKGIPMAKGRKRF